jgi:hypothetical protein
MTPSLKPWIQSLLLVSGRLPLGHEALERAFIFDARIKAYIAIAARADYPRKRRKSSGRNLA